MNSFSKFKSQVLIRNALPYDKLDPEKNFLLYDKQLEAQEFDDLDLMQFVKSFRYSLGVKAGESLKNFKNFPAHFEGIVKKWPQPISRSHGLVALGGGTLGDFAGFAASIFKRGIPLVHIPTTWLAAIDSAHGGKNALNMAGVKNQIGTFYPAQKVFVIKNLLEGSPQDLKMQAYGELVKMGLVGDSQFFKEIFMEKRPAEDFFWRFLKFAIEDKYHLVLQDPFETKKIRQILNFGHTLGHAFESHFEWPHGDCVLQGIFFALEWSRYRGDLSQSLYDQILATLAQKFDRVPAHKLSWYRKPSKKIIQKLVAADKKVDTDGRVNFIFLKSIGQAIVRPIPIDDLISEAQRQSWVR